MKTKSGYETNGTYIKYKSGYIDKWIVETETNRNIFTSE